MSRLIRPLASLKLTVSLLALAMLLVFLGTIAQTRLGVWHVVDAYFRAPIAWVDLSLFFPLREFRPSVPLPGGFTLGVLLFLNLAAAHVTRFRLVRRKFGILVIHTGLVLLLAGEFATGLFADEGMMRIDEGRHSSFAEDIREVEFVIVDFSGSTADRVITVPGSRLREAAASGQPVRDPLVPVEIAVEQWFDNARLLKGREPAATTGTGLVAFPQRLPPQRGVDSATPDLPAAIVTLRHEGRVLGTWLTWAGLDELQPMTAEGRTWGLGLRFVRTYLPFEVHLEDFRHDIFTGTTIPRNFSSDVRLVDGKRGVDRHVRIWMNHPLRYQGLTFYQASYKPDGSGTVLQVVRNPGWLLPYFSCALVGLGLCWHFGASLTRFARRPASIHGRNSPVARVSRFWILAGTVGGLLLAGAAFLRPPFAEPALRVVAGIPVSSGGRIKPLDTAARNLLMVAGGRSAIRTPEGSIPAIQFFLDLVTRPESVKDLPIIRVDDPGVLSLLDLSPDEGGRISLAQVEPHWSDVASQAAQAAAIPPREREPFQRALLQFHDRVNAILSHAQLRDPLIVAPLKTGQEWRSFHDAFSDTLSETAAEPHPSVAYMAALLDAWSAGDLERFAQIADAYDALLRRDLPGAHRRAELEVLFNHASPFRSTIVIYLLALLALLGSLLLRQAGGDCGCAASERARRVAVGLLIAGAVIHTLAIAARMYLQGRPPVTNLYSSAVFVGWAAAVAGLALERVFPLGLAALGSAGIGLCSLIIAHNLGNDGDTLQMMQAVLDSNFWLATHVVTITLGYSASFLAGTLGALYIVTLALRRPSRSLPRMTYGVVCFALLLSFLGTVLGGIWADQSWGRFWGWDPKENGAALIVLLHALILHARWGGLIRERGLAVLAVAGNIVTAWSWFGTNMLGVGLHSYGFMSSAMYSLAIFVVIQAGLILMGVFLPTAPRQRVHTET